MNTSKAALQSCSDRNLRFLGSRQRAGFSSFWTARSYPLEVFGYSRSARSMYLCSQILVFKLCFTACPIGAPPEKTGRGFDVAKGKDTNSPSALRASAVRQAQTLGSDVIVCAPGATSVWQVLPLQCLHLIAVRSAASADTGSWLWCLYLCGCGIVPGCIGTLSAASTDTGGTCLFTVTQGGFVSLRRSEVLNYFSEGLHLFGHGLIGLHQGGQQHLGVIHLANLFRCVGRLSPCFSLTKRGGGCRFLAGGFLAAGALRLGMTDYLKHIQSLFFFFFIYLLIWYFIDYWINLKPQLWISCYCWC